MWIRFFKHEPEQLSIMVYKFRTKQPLVLASSDKVQSCDRPHSAHLWHHIWHELLSPEAGLDGHHKHHVHLGDEGDDLLHRCVRLDGDTNLQEEGKGESSEGSLDHSVKNFCGCYKHRNTKRNACPTNTDPKLQHPHP